MLEQFADFVRECAYMAYIAYREDKDLSNLVGHWERWRHLEAWADLLDGGKNNYDFYRRYEDENFEEPTDEEYNNYALGIR